MDDPRKSSEKQGPPGQDRPDEHDASSATGIFGRETIPPRPPGEYDPLASLLRQAHSPGAGSPVAPNTFPPVASPAPVPAVVPAVDPKSGGSGEVTRILQRVKPAAPKQDLAGVFRQVPIEKPPAPKDQPSKPEPLASNTPPHSGSFTQAFRELSAKASASPAAPPPVAPGPETSQLGEFTKMFQSVQTPPEPNRPRADFAPVPPSGSSGDSLTQLFAKSVPSAEAPRQSWMSDPKPESPFPASAPVPRNEQALPVEGGFTQLFQALNETPLPAAKPPDLPHPPAPAPGPAVAGGFTQLLQSLSPKESPPSMAPVTPVPIAPVPGVPAAPVATPASAGPGEYTRVISASALRESQARVAAAPAAAPASPGVRPPGATPPIPMQPAMPPMPAAQMPHAAPMAAPYAAAGQMPGAMAPPAFSFPPVAPPAAPPAPAPQPSGLQKFLPLILLVNIFLMLAILLVLIFVLRHK